MPPDADVDHVAFEVIVRSYTDDVWRVARSIVRDDEQAEDIVQDTFLKAYRSLSRFRGEASMKTWLITICQRTCLDHLRTRRAQIVPLAEARYVRSRSDDADTRMAIDAGMRHLGEDERVAFTLVDVAGFSREEAAAIVGVPASTMRSRVARARARLLEAIDEAGIANQRRERS